MARATPKRQGSALKLVDTHAKLPGKHRMWRECLPGTIAFGYVSGRSPKLEWSESMVAAMHTDFRHGYGRFDHDNPFCRSRSGANIWQARNKVTREFLTATKAEWLLVVDDDMRFDATAHEQLALIAEANNITVLGGLCIAQRKGAEAGLSIGATIYEVNEAGEPSQWEDYPENTVVGQGPNSLPLATGAAFKLVHRSAILDIACAAPQTAWPWYRELLGPNDNPIPEDFFFCIAAHQAGHPVYIHTGVKTGHIKEVEMNEELARSDYSKVVFV